MEVSLEAIISLIGILVGGGSIGGFLFWKQTKKRAEAEAKQAEAEAKLKEAEARKAEIEVEKERQDYYQQLAKDLAEDREDKKRQNEELRQERDQYKKERNEFRDLQQQRDEEFRKFRIRTEEELDELRRKQARQGRQIEVMRPFLCGDLKCPKRQGVSTFDTDALERTIKIDKTEPNNED